MTTASRRNFWYLLVYSTLGLSPAMSLACQDAPVDGPMTSSSASLTTSSDSAQLPVVLTGDSGHQGEGRGAWVKERIDRLFERFDKDHDGKIALKDLPDRLQARLARADVNHDGFVTRDELTQAWQASAAEMKKKIDTNGDGVISDEERAKARAAFWDKRFAEFDKNKDGALTADEVPARMWDHIKVADANNDNKVTRAEIDAAIAAGKLGPMHRGHHEHSGGTSKA